jgi:hypothetical protein
LISSDRWLLFEGSVGAVGVVVVEVADDEAVELSLVPDEGAVEQLAAQGADPTLGERVGDRGPDGTVALFDRWSR